MSTSEPAPYSPAVANRRPDAWTVPVEQRPACPLDGRPCPSWTCLVDVCVAAGDDVPSTYGTPEAQRVRADVDRDLLREVLEALCDRDGLSIESSVVPGEPARNYELALRLGIGPVFGLTGGSEPLPDRSPEDPAPKDSAS